MKLALFFISLFAVLSAESDASRDQTYLAGTGEYPLIRFVSPDDTLLLTATDDAYVATDSFVAINGTETSASRAGRFGVLLNNQYLLVDRGHLLLPRLGSGPTQYDLSPEVQHYTPLQQQVLSWITNAGGIERRAFPATTSATADLSCALGANGSIASWRPGDAASFWSSAPGRYNDIRSYVSGVYCLRAEGREFVAIVATGRGLPAATRTAVLIYEAHKASPPAMLFLSHDENLLPVSDFSQPAADTIVGWTNQEIRDLPNGDSEYADSHEWMVARISFRDGAWKYDCARLDGWPVLDRQRIMFFGKTELWVAPRSTATAVYRVRWPYDRAELAYSPETLIENLSPFQKDVAESGFIIPSPSGRYVLWLRVTRADWSTQLSEAPR